MSFVLEIDRQLVLNMAMKVLFLIFLLTCGHVVTAQDSKAVQAFAGCYELRVGGWRPFILNFPPRRFQLTTRPVKSGFEAMDLDSKGRWEQPWDSTLTAWNVTSEGKVEIVWSTGFVGWNILLSRPSGANLRGTANYFTDTDTKPSRAVTVVAHSVDCKVLAKRGQLDWLLSPPFSPLFWILAVLFFALLFAASRFKNKLLRVFLFWIPTLTVSVFCVAIGALFTYLFISSR
jgi:hypothetical protein